MILLQGVPSRPWGQSGGREAERMILLQGVPWRTWGQSGGREAERG